MGSNNQKEKGLSALNAAEHKLILSEIVHVEEFLKMIGFKRTEAAIYGLLVLTPEPLTAEQIENSLGLSQGAVSQGLKTLTHWGAVESRYDPELRLHRHQAVEDSLAIVSSVFQKREKGAVYRLKEMALRCQEYFIAQGENHESARVRRLNSIITTCEFAEVIMGFVSQLAKLGVGKQYSKLVRTLPKSFELIIQGSKFPGLRRHLQERKGKPNWH